MEDWQKPCGLCGSKDDLDCFPISKIMEVAGTQNFLEGTFFICEECLNKLKKCSYCGKYIKTPEIEKILDGFYSGKFCSCKNSTAKEICENGVIGVLENINKEKQYIAIPIVAAVVSIVINLFIFADADFPNDLAIFLLSCCGVGMPINWLISQLFGVKVANWEFITKYISEKLKKINNYVVLLIITICFLFVACAGENLDYGFYQLLRFAVTILSSWNAVKVYKENQQSFWLVVFIAIAILFNPVIKITFEREIWQTIDSVTLGAFICYYGYSVTTKKQL